MRGRAERRPAAITHHEYLRAKRAVSDEWSQIMADVMARPVLQVADARFLNARATAFLAFRQAGLADLGRIDRFCPIRRRYEPRNATSELYARLFETFVTAYEQNRGIFARLNTDPGLHDGSGS